MILWLGGFGLLTAWYGNKEQWFMKKVNLSNNGMELKGWKGFWPQLAIIWANCGDFGKRISTKPSTGRCNLIKESNKILRSDNCNYADYLEKKHVYGHSSIHKRKTDKTTYRFLNHCHLYGIILYSSKCFLLTLTDKEQRVRVKFPPSIICRLRLILK